MRMPFGRYKGAALADLPDDYLAWLTGLDLREPLKTGVATERRRRTAPPSRDLPSMAPEVKTMALELVTVGYRRLAQTYHPDHDGGSNQTMTALNLAMEGLREWLRSGK